MTEEKKLTDKELENASGAGPNISSQKTGNRGTYGTGQVQSEPTGETEPNPIRDQVLGEIQAGAGGSISSKKTAIHGAAEESHTHARQSPGVTGNTDPV